MNLNEVLALRPPEGADAATITAAIGTATRKRAELLALAATADQVRADGLLSTDDKAMQRAENDALQARRAVERIDALTPRVRLDLEAAQARETMAALHIQADAVCDAGAAVAQWQADKLPAFWGPLREGFVLHDRMTAQCAKLRADIEAAYRDPNVRELGQFFPDLTVKGWPDADKMPRKLFSSLRFD